jgi:hypothetical protein
MYNGAKRKVGTAIREVSARAKRKAVEVRAEPESNR